LKNTLIFLVLCPILIISCGTDKKPLVDFKSNQCVLLSSEIHGGTPTSENAWTSTVAITTQIRGKPKQYCSGVLVTEDVVLTAAHCLLPWLKPFEENLRIYIGNGALKGEFDGQYGVKEAVIHPNYLLNENATNDIYDFAYIMLSEPVDLEKVTIFPVIQTQEKMNEIMEHLKNEVTIVGYGYTEQMSTGVKYEVTTTINSHTNTEMSIGGNGKDTCRGDSGGPVYVKLSNKYHVLGITSRGGVCGEVEYMEKLILP